MSEENKKSEPKPQRVQLVQLDPERCRGCELCLEICPNELFAPGQEPNAQGYFPVQMNYADYCINCLRCVQICPDLAFDVPKQPGLNWPGHVFGWSLHWHRFWNRHDR